MFAMPLVPAGYRRTKPVSLHVVPFNTAGVPTGCSLFTPTTDQPRKPLDGLEPFDAVFNPTAQSLNDGQYSLVCTDVHPTSAPSVAPSSSPTAVPSFSPTAVPSFSPTAVPSFSPTSHPTESPTTGTPTAAPTPTQENPHYIAIAKERATKAAEKAKVVQELHDKTAKKLALIAERSKKSTVKFNIVLAKDVKEAENELEEQMAKVIRLHNMCKDGENAVIDHAFLMKELHATQLSSEARATALYKAQLVKSLSQYVEKLRTMHDLNYAHGMYAMRKLGTQLMAAAKDIKESVKVADMGIELVHPN
jgi:hypothetical protein